MASVQAKLRQYDRSAPCVLFPFSVVRQALLHMTKRPSSLNQFCCKTQCSCRIAVSTSAACRYRVACCSDRCACETNTKTPPRLAVALAYPAHSKPHLANVAPIPAGITPRWVEAGQRLGRNQHSDTLAFYMPDRRRPLSPPFLGQHCRTLRSNSRCQNRGSHTDSDRFGPALPTLPDAKRCTHRLCIESPQSRQRPCTQEPVLLLAARTRSGSCSETGSVWVWTKIGPTGRSGKLPKAASNHENVGWSNIEIDRSLGYTRSPRCLEKMCL